MTKKYVQLKCSICSRTRDSRIDLKYYSADKCTITLGCEGRLSPIGETSDGTSLISVPPIGLQNWYARGTNPAAPVPLTNEELYNTSTGGTQQFIIAVEDASIGFTPNSTSTFTLNLIAEQQQVQDFRQYTYRKTSAFTIINGVEDSIAKKVLRYSLSGPNPDQVQVLVNGVKRNSGLGASDYQLYDGSIGSPVPPNSVLFNSPVAGAVSQVDVIVTKAATLSALSLPFSRMIDDDSRLGTGSWEGIDAITRLGSRWSLFFCDFSEILSSPVDVRLRLNPNVPNTITQNAFTSVVSPNFTSALFSRTNLYTEIDRIRASWAPISLLTNESNYLVIKRVDNKRELFITRGSAVDFFPAAEVLRYNTAQLTRTNLTGNSTANELNSNITIGPDA